MSFTSFDRPKVGEVARCLRCKVTYIANVCPCGGLDCGVAMYPVGHELSGVSDVIGARLVADRTSEFCPNCWTPEEYGALKLREQAQARGAADN